MTLAASFGMVSERAAAQMPHGAAYGWGSNTFGELISGSSAPVYAPTALAGLGDVVDVQMGGSYTTHILKPDGTVWGRGVNSAGQLGNGTYTDSSVLVQAQGLENVTQIAASVHVVALRSDGTVWAWGDNSEGELGIGSDDFSRNVPVQVPGLTNVIQIAVGIAHTVAVKADGTVWAWGRNDTGELGDGTTDSSNVPVQVSSIGNVVKVAASFHNVAMKADGTIWAWGYNNNGQIGDGTRNNNRLIPVPVPIPDVGPLKIVDVAVGWRHSLAVRSDGTVWGWGLNGEGELGTGVRDISISPVQVPNFGNAKAVVGGYLHSVALKSDGTVWTWGSNGRGELGVGLDAQTKPHSLVPLRVTSLNNALAIPRGAVAHGLAITSPSVPFESANAKLTVTAGPPPGFDLNETITLAGGSDGVNPATEATTLQIGEYSLTFPAGSFRSLPNGRYAFAGVIDGVSLSAQLQPISSQSFALKVSALGVNLTGLTNPVAVAVTIGDDSGTTTTTAKFN